MLELFFLVPLTRKIDEICLTKGRAGAGYRVLLILLWCAGEIAGAILGLNVTASEDGPVTIWGAAIVYGVALIGAALGAIFCFGVVYGLAHKTATG